MYGYIYEGTYKTDDFINGSLLKPGVPYSSSTGRANVKPGDPKYRDINGDGVIDDNDRTVIGCGQPVHTGGFGNTFYFYGFDVNIFFSWSYGNDVLNANRLIFENGNTANLNQLATYNNRFDVDRNPDSDIPAIGANDMFVYSSRVVEDGSYLRLKNVTLSYYIPIRTTYLQGITVWGAANNLFTITRYLGNDPEFSASNDVLLQGIDRGLLAQGRNFSLGIKINL